MKGKKGLALGMAGIMVLGMCGCQKGEAGQTAKVSRNKVDMVSASEQRTVHAMITWNEDKDWGKVLKGLSEEYMKEHPDFNVEIETIAQTDMPQKLSVLAASNELPELFVMGTPD